MYLELLNPPYYGFDGCADANVFLAGVFHCFGKDCSLVMESSSQEETIKNALAGISDRIGEAETTCSIVNGRFAPGLRYELHLGRTMPKALSDICEHHATLEYCDNCFVFRAGAPILLWFDFNCGDCNDIVVRPEVEEEIVRALAARTELRWQKRQ